MPQKRERRWERAPNFWPNIRWPEMRLFHELSHGIVDLHFRWGSSYLPPRPPSLLVPPLPPSFPTSWIFVTFPTHQEEVMRRPTEISLSLESFNESQLLLSQLMGGLGWPTWKAAKWMHNRKVTSHEMFGVFIKESEEMKRRVQSLRRCRDARRTWSSLAIIKWS